MQYQRLGSAGLMVSRICLGMMSYGDTAARPGSPPADVEAIVRRAVEGGVTFFDTADSYLSGASERVTGRLLRQFFPDRGDYVLATKVYHPTGPGPNDRGLSRAHILAAVDASLRRLGVDHIDLYQIHRWDDGTPIEETMQALHDLVLAGKVRYLGASKMSAWQLVKAQCAATANGWTRFVSIQVRWNLVYREEERDMVPCCADQGVGVLPYSPLARGLLAGPGAAPAVPAAERPGDGAGSGVLAALRELSARRGVPPAQLALGWLLGRPAVTAPVVGPTSVEHLADAFAALQTPLSDAEVAVLEAPYQPQPPR